MSGDVELGGPNLEIDGISEDAIHDGLPVAGHAHGMPVVVVRHNNQYCAVSGTCTHYGAPLADGICANGVLHCPWHHAEFDVTTGRVVGAPALSNLTAFTTSVRDGRVYVGSEKQIPPSPPVSSPESVVIVGAGAAGDAAAVALREYGYSGPITMFGTEWPADRPNLSKDFLAGNIPEEWIPIRSAEFYANHRITVVLDNDVVAIDRTNKMVSTRNGDAIRYGALLLATGAAPRTLPIPGADGGNVYYLRTYADSKSIVAAAQHATSAVVIGAGFIGLEVAAALRTRNIGVSIVAPEKIPLASIVGHTLGSFVADVHRKHGVQMYLENGVKRINADSVELTSGAVVPADIVVIGAGVIPRTELAEDASLLVDKGIVVNEFLQTADPAIWAAGDVARYPAPSGSSTRIEHWAHAQRMGAAAAMNIIGASKPFTAQPFFWSQHYDVTINVVGNAAGWDTEVVSGNPHNGEVLVGYRRNSDIVAVASIYRDKESLLAEQALTDGNQGALEDLLSVGTHLQ